MTRVPRPRYGFRAAPEAERQHEAGTIDECPGCDAELDEHDDWDQCRQCGESPSAAPGVPAGHLAARPAAGAAASSVAGR